MQNNVSAFADAAGSQKNEEMVDTRVQLHQPNIIGNIEDMSIQDSVDELELASLDNNNDMFSKSKSKSLTRKQAKAA